MAFNLDRFKKAQSYDYTTALEEIRAGEKQSHWMWYIFPQLEELGYSEMAKYYGIKGIEEARAYLADELLRSRLVEISEALLSLKSNDASLVMGYPDDIKLRSSMTLFLLASGENTPDGALFQKVLDKFFAGKPDERTVKLCS